MTYKTVKIDEDIYWEIKKLCFKLSQEQRERYTISRVLRYLLEVEKNVGKMGES